MNYSVLFLLLTAPLFASENPGATAAPVLQVPIGARAVGMGTAFTAVASDVSALYYNPAGLSRLGSHEVGATFIQGLIDSNLQQIAYGGPLRFAGFAGSGYASLGSSLLYNRKGTVEVNLTNPDGSFLATNNISAGWDLVATVAYSERVGAQSFDLGQKSYQLDHFAGAAGKLIHSTLVEQFSATAYAGDVGYLAVFPDIGFSAAFSALNLGNNMTFLDNGTGDPLPATLRFGLAQQWGRLTVHDFTLAADGDYLLYDRIWHANVGGEYYWLKTFALRVGYQFEREKVGLTVGAGVKWRDRILLDYAWASEAGNSFTDTHRFTVTYRFGSLTASARSRPRRPFVERAPETEPSPVEQEIVPAVQPPPRRTGPKPKEEKPAMVPGWIY